MFRWVLTLLVFLNVAAHADERPLYDGVYVKYVDGTYVQLAADYPTPTIFKFYYAPVLEGGFLPEYADPPLMMALNRRNSFPLIERENVVSIYVKSRTVRVDYVANVLFGQDLFGPSIEHLGAAGAIVGQLDAEELIGPSDCRKDFSNRIITYSNIEFEIEIGVPDALASTWIGRAQGAPNECTGSYISRGLAIVGTDVVNGRNVPAVFYGMYPYGEGLMK